MDLDALLSRMTLPEKLAQLGCVWCATLTRDDAFAPDKAARRLQHGIGEITRIGATTGLDPRSRAALTNAIQRFLLDETRLGIPAIVHEESTAGLCARDATQFPQAIGLAATWNPELLERIGVVIRQQMVATGARHTLAPVLDVARDPRWGRVEETYGESAYLAARLGVAYVRGVQGSLVDGVAATGKHFLGYSLSEGGLNHAPVHLGPRELREVYAERFRAAIAEADLATVMNSYASVDGVACGASKSILDDLLRGELGFAGAVVADYSTTEWLITHHRVAANKGEAAARALAAGLDMELPQLDCYGEPLQALIEAGDVDEALVDRSVRRVLELKQRLGLFEQPYVNEDAATDVYFRESDRVLAYDAAVESIVLLKNDGVLPLAPDASVAVLGPAADDVRLLQGDYSYPAHTEIVQGPAGFAGGPYYPDSVTPLAGMVARAGAVLDGTKGADVAVCFVGGRSGLMQECTTGEFRDVMSLELERAQLDVIRATIATGVPTVVVVISGRVHSLEWVAEQAAALVYAWVPGEQGGAAIADVLYGVKDPSGRLPITLPRNAGQIPIHHDTRAGGGRSIIYGDYVDGPAAPLFPFGYGKSYTKFRYADLAAAGCNVRVTVTNTGDRAGTDVVQLFARDVVARVARPERTLVGFARVPLEPDESRTVSFAVDESAFAYYDEAMQLVIEPGAIEFMVGPLRVASELTGPERVIAPNDRRPSTASVS